MSLVSRALVISLTTLEKLSMPIICFRHRSREAFALSDHTSASGLMGVWGAIWLCLSWVGMGCSGEASTHWVESPREVESTVSSEHTFAHIPIPKGHKAVTLSHELTANTNQLVTRANTLSSTHSRAVFNAPGTGDTVLPSAAIKPGGPPAQPKLKVTKTPNPKATHVVFDTYMDPKGETWLALHENLKRNKPHVAKLKDGTELRELESKLGKKKSWSKVKVLSGPHKGASGYLHAGWIQAIPKVTSGPKTPKVLLFRIFGNEGDGPPVTGAELLKKGFIDPDYGLNLININPGGMSDDVLPPTAKKVCKRSLKKQEFLLAYAECEGFYCMVQPGAHISERYEFVERKGRLVLDTVIVGLSDFASVPTKYQDEAPDEYVLEAERFIHKQRAKLGKKRCR